MSGGLGILVGPTGGYIVGFLATAIIMGLYLDKFGITFTQAIIANIIGMIVTLAFGTVWLKIVADYTWTVCLYGWCCTIYRGWYRQSGTCKDGLV